MKRALVTGAAGFIGSHLVDSLLSENWSVTAVDNFDAFYAREIKQRNIAGHRDFKNYSLIELDICDRAALHALGAGDYDVIVHLAAKAGVRPSILDPFAYQQVNVIGTQNVLELARMCGVRQFVLASSSSVYGVNPNVPWQESDHVLLPISPYASTKVSTELLSHVYWHLYGIRIMALRFFTVFGPRQRPDLAIHKFARLIAERRPVPIYGDGSTSRDYTYVADIVEGVRAAMEYDKTGYEIFNLGNNQAISLLEMVRTIGDAFSLKPLLEFAPEQPGDVPQTRADISKAQVFLGYHPVTSFKEGIRTFAEWFERESVCASGAGHLGS
ncbi:MAG: GDP-mannose 4,6-dehydratase [Acidobacteriaceae bacterium]|nr:GDP-mannose 4,6-dehydratase [Acidobacteriaceae bacterium]MBV9782134.1 GDP-mannose 4,6-dehydratase [Acidobacteriaceae bacterium]